MSLVLHTLHLGLLHVLFPWGAKVLCIFVDVSSDCRFGGCLLALSGSVLHIVLRVGSCCSCLNTCLRGL